MKRLQNTLLATAVLLLSSAALAQKTQIIEGGAPTGTITDGAASFAYNSIGAGGAANADFTGVGAGDELFSLWWYFRVSGDAQETPFPGPDTENYTGATATLDWADVASRGFSAQLINVVADGGGPSGTLTSALTLTNLGGAPLTLDLFWYVDADVGGSAGGDSAVLTTDPTLITVTDTDTVEVLGGANNAYQVLAWPGMRDLLSDGASDNLDNSGLPFGPGDYTSGMQWAGITIDPASSVLIEANLGVNMAAPPPTGGPGGGLPEPAEVPTMNLVGLILLALVLAAMTAFTLRRRA